MLAIKKATPSFEEVNARLGDQFASVWIFALEGEPLVAEPTAAGSV